MLAGRAPQKVDAISRLAKTLGEADEVTTRLNAIH